MCPRCKDPNAKAVKKGFFFKEAGPVRRIQRYRCKRCG